MLPDQRVPPGSFVHQEVERLYNLAQSLRPTAADRWNRELYATSLDTLGGLDPKTSALRLSRHRVLMHLTGSVSPGRTVDQSEALATILHEATHGGMQIKAPAEPNAVWSEHSHGVMEGVAEVRAFADFELFATRAGYRGLPHGDPRYPGAFAATSDLMAHVTGPTYSHDVLIDDVCRGPGLMHFDQFAHAVVVNQLNQLTHRDESTQLAVRAELIESMLHAHWPTLPNTEAGTGHAVAKEIRSKLDAKIDELRHRHRLPPPGTEQPTHPTGPRPAPPNATARTDTVNSLRFLTAHSPPTGATHKPHSLARTTAHQARPPKPPTRTRD